MWLGNMKEHKITFAWLMVIGGLFYVMNIWTPLFVDDFFYCFIFKTHVHINSFCDVIKSQYLHYLEMNGRFIPHFFAQYIEGVWGKPFFNVINTFVFIIFLYVLSITVDQKKECFYKTITVSAASVFLFIPTFGQSFLWMTGSFNYLWVSLAVLLFNMLLQRKSIHSFLYPIYFSVGLACGWTHEGFIIGLCTSYFLYFYRYPKELSGSKIALLFGLFVGCAFLVFSPGSFHRASLGFTNNTLVDWIRSYILALMAFDNLCLPFILIIVLIIMFWKRKEYANRFIHENQIWFVALIVSFLFIWFTRQTTTRSRFSLEFFSLIILLRLIIRLNIHKKVLHGINVVVFLFAIAICYVCYQNYSVYRDAISQIREGKDVVYTDDITCNKFFHRFIVNQISMPMGSYFLHKDKHIGEYYDNTSLVFLPKPFMSRFAAYENEHVFYTEKDLPFYCKKVESGDINQVVFHLSPTDFSALPFYVRPFARNLERYTVTSLVCHQTYVIEIDKSNFLLLVEKNEAVDNRVEQISISDTEKTVEYPVVEVDVQ